MFVRNLSIQLKPNSLTNFTTHFVKEIIPSLHKQKGFQNELIFGEPGTDSVTAISFWDTKENADLYAAAGGCLGVALAAVNLTPRASECGPARLARWPPA